MRSLMILSMLASGVSAPAAATAQVGPVVQHRSPMPPMVRPGGWQAPRSGSTIHRGRWGGAVNGRWYAGVYAPGGWASYRRPVRGWVLPTYWYSPSFFINDYAGYGLGAPPAGYTWSRYYDDAVLVDGRGRVYDSVSGLDWNRYDEVVEDEISDRSVEHVYVDRDSGAGAPPPPVPPARRDDGLGGAVVGGVVGGVAGNVIAGRGNRVAGTVIGAGVGAVAGAAIDRAEDRGRYRDAPPPPPPSYGAPYAEPGYDHRDERRVVVRERHRPERHVDVVREREGPWIDYDSSAYRAGPYTTVVNGAWGATTVVTVVPAVTTTTTSTSIEYVYEAPIVRTYRKKVWRAKAKPRARQCTCVCKVVCR
jgi:Ni/Co efflux regulator RcnB